jgi:predicted RNA-binding Zn ribbon-like protein
MITEPITAPLRFPLLGVPLSLDLVNTRVRKGGVDVDLLDGPSALTVWLAAEAGRQPWDGTATATDLRVVRLMRDAIAELLAAMRTRVPPRQRALQTVNAALSSSTTSIRLVWTPTGPRAKARSATLGRDALLHALAVDAVSILTGPQAKLLRRCAHPECVLQFLARNPRRLWCSAAVCGNRTRVARHYLRQQANG